MNRILGLVRSRVGRVGIAAGVITAAVLGFAAPAYAHHTVLHGSTECSNGDNVVTWSIQNVSVVHLPMTIASANATLGGATYAVTGYTPTINDGDTTYATTTVPFGNSGTITLHVHSTWPDGVTYNDQTSVELISNCTTTTTASTTTTTTTTTTLPPTTTTEAPTTTTEAPTTTTTLGEQGSTTTEAPTTTAAPTTTTVPPCTESTTTTTIGEQGSTTSAAPTTVPETTESTTTTVPCTESTSTTLPPPTTTTTFGEQGSTSVPVTVPPTTGPTTPPTGEAATTLVQQDTQTSAPAAVTGQLPRTGNDNGLPLALGVGCLAAGGLLALRRRKAWSR